MLELEAGALLADQSSPLTCWDPSPIPAGRCVVPTLFFSCLQTRNGAFSDALSKCCLKTCAGTPRGVIVCMNQSRAFWMHQSEQDANYYFFSLTSSVLKLN